MVGPEQQEKPMMLASVTVSRLNAGFVVEAHLVDRQGGQAQATFACETLESLRATLKKVAPFIYESPIVVPGMVPPSGDLTKLPGEQS